MKLIWPQLASLTQNPCHVSCFQFSESGHCSQWSFRWEPIWYIWPEYQKYVDIRWRSCHRLQHISISFWYLGLLYTSQELQVITNALKCILAAVFKSAMRILAPKMSFRKQSTQAINHNDFTREATWLTDFD